MKTNLFSDSNFIYFILLITISISMSLYLDSRSIKGTDLQTSPSDKNKKVLLLAENKTCLYSSKSENIKTSLNILLPYPCDWVKQNGENDNVIKKFNKVYDDGSSLEQMLLITDMKMSIPKKQQDLFLSEKILSQGMDSEKDKLLFFYRIDINGNPSAKMAYKTDFVYKIKRLSSIVIQYFILYESYLIRVQFVASAENTLRVNELYESNKMLFDSLSSGLKINN